MRNHFITKRGWTSLMVVCVCMAISAVYELVERAAALISVEAAESFLGTQGDHWDTQTDMFCALIGSVAALVLLRCLHNRSMLRQRNR